MENLILNTTYQSGVYYIQVGKLPRKLQNLIRKTKPELENSSYTVGENSGFIRGELKLNGKLYDFEVSLGSCDIRHADYSYSDELDSYIDDSGRPIDEDEYSESFLNELWAITEVENLDVYLTLKD